MHLAPVVTVGHFLVHDAAASRHPLYIARPQTALITQRVSMIDRTGDHEERALVYEDPGQANRARKELETIYTEDPVVEDVAGRLGTG